MSAERQKPRPSRQNLKLSDWLTVFAYIDMHPTLSQTEVVKHFATLESGALVFMQSTLSRKLQIRLDLEQRARNNPLALDSKRHRVVTRPDVERAPFLCVQHMEAKGEQVNGPMLKEKRCEPTLDDFIEPNEELEDLDSTVDIFEGGDKAIVARVVQEMAEQSGEVVNVDSDDDDESGTPDISRSEAINLCEILTEACLQHGHASTDHALGLLTHLHRFRVFLRQEDSELIQTTLDDFFTPVLRA